MPAIAKSLAVRVGMEGDAEVDRKFDEQGAHGEAAYDRVGAAAMRMAAQAYQASETVSGAMARQSASVTSLSRDLDAHVRSYNIFVREQQAAAGKLRDVIDPLGAAERAYKVELEQVIALGRRGAITAQEQAAAEALLRKNLDETTNAIKRRTGQGGGLSSQFKLNALYQATDIATGIGSGQNLGIVALQQGGQILGMVAAEGMAATGSILGLGAAITSVGGIMIGAIALQESYAQGLAKDRAAAEGLGRAAGLSGEQLRALAEAEASRVDISVGQARKMAAAYVSTGRIGEDVLTGLIDLTRDYAVTTSQNIPEATDTLAKAFSDPAKGAKALNEQLHFLTDGQLLYVEQLARSNDKTAAQKELMGQLAPVLLRSREEMTELGRATNDTRNAFSGLLNTIGEVLSPSLDEKLERAQKNLRLATGSAGGWSEYTVDEARVNLAKALADVDERDRQLAARTASSRSNLSQADIRSLVDQALPHAALSRELQGRLEQLNAAKADPQGVSPAEIQRSIDVTTRQISRLKQETVEAATAAETHAQALAREQAALVASAAGATKVADAYLQSSTAGAKAEAERKAAVAGAKAGQELNGRATAELALSINQEGENAAKSARQIGDLAAAQKLRNDAVAAGLLSSADANVQAQTETALYGIEQAQLSATAADKERLVRATDALRTALMAQNEEARRAQTLAATETANDNVMVMQAQLDLLRATNEERAVELARIRATQEMEAKGKGYSNTADAQAYIAGKIDEAHAQSALDRGQSLEQMRRSGEEAYRTALAEQYAVGKTADERDQIVASMQLYNQLVAAGIDPLAREAAILYDQAEALRQINAFTRQLQAANDELVSAEQRVVEDLNQALTPDHWMRWGDAAKAVFNDLFLEAEKLAVLNPLKNILFGETLPTLGGVLGGFGKQAGSIASLGHEIGHNAGGTDWWRGGLTWLNEDGPELVRLPRGSQVVPHRRSMDMLSQAAARTVHYAPVNHFYGANDDVMDQVRAENARQSDELARLFHGAVPAIMGEHEWGMVG